MKVSGIYVKVRKGRLEMRLRYPFEMKMEEVIAKVREGYQDFEIKEIQVWK